MHKKLFSIFIIILVFKFCIYPDSYSQKKIIQIEYPSELEKGILYGITETGGKIYLTYLSDNRQIKLASLNNISGKLFPEFIKDIYKYEEQDSVIYLEIFAEKGAFYIMHLEKYAYDLFMSHIDPGNNISKIKIGTTKSPPSIFLDNKSLRCFLIKTGNDALIYENIDLQTFKVKEISGENLIDSFLINYDPSSKNSIAVWKAKNEKKNVYISTMDKNFNGHTSIMELKFNQSVELPKVSINSNYFKMVFKDGQTNKFIVCPLNGDIRDYYAENFDERFKDYRIEEYFSLRNYNILIFKKTEETASKEKNDIIETVFFDTDFKIIKSFLMDDGIGICSNFKYIYLQGKFYLFWLEKSSIGSFIKYTSFSF
jgi:hypothetical protein